MTTLRGAFTKISYILLALSLVVAAGCGSTADDKACRSYNSGGHIEIQTGQVMLTWEQQVTNPLVPHGLSAQQGAATGC